MNLRKNLDTTYLKTVYRKVCVFFHYVLLITYVLK